MATRVFDQEPTGLNRIRNGFIMEPYIYYGASMPNISVKDVPEAWAEALRQRAARNHRSLQGELMAIIEQAARESLLGAAETQAAARTDNAATQSVGLQRGNPATQRGWKTIEQIATEHRLRFPQPVTGIPLAVDIIRADRDAR